MQLIEKEGMTLMRREDGYVNATALCKQGGKLFADYRGMKTTKAFLEELSSDMGIPISQLSISLKGRSYSFEQGSYVHPLVAINLAQWISPKFAVFVSECMFGLMTGQKKVDTNFSGLISTKRVSPSIYPSSLRKRIASLYGGGAPFIYNRIVDKALGEGAAAELRRVAGKSSPRWMFLTLEGKGKLQQFVRLLDEQTAMVQTMSEFESVLFGQLLLKIEAQK